MKLSKRIKEQWKNQNNDEQLNSFRKLRRRKEFHKINEIRIRLEERDIIENNPDWSPLYFWNGDSWQLDVWCDGLTRTYFPDLWYLFELLEWSRSKRYTL